MARIVPTPPTQEEIDVSCADAIRAYKGYERRRLLPLYILIAALLTFFVALVEDLLIKT